MLFDERRHVRRRRCGDHRGGAGVEARSFGKRFRHATRDHALRSVGERTEDAISFKKPGGERCKEALPRVLTKQAGRLGVIVYVIRDRLRRVRQVCLRVFRRDALRLHGAQKTKLVNENI